MVKVAVVEDDKTLAVELVSFLKRYEQEKETEIQERCFSRPTDFLSSNDKFDIVFMDIEFKNDIINGLEASRKLRKRDSVTLLIFVTSFEQFAVKGYEVDAFDFIVKPIAYQDFALRLHRALQRVYKENSESIQIRSKGNIAIVPIKDIKYIEVIKHNLFFHTLNGIIEGNGSLNEMEKTLAPNHFVRCNHCYLVNLWYVKGVEDYTIDLGGEEIAVSRSKKKEFMSVLNRYLAK